MEIFKSIVVAIDFSEASLAAYQYAYQLASHSQASLKVVHIYQINVTTERPDVPNPIINPSDMQEIAELRMAQFIHKADNQMAGSVNVTTDVQMGFTSEYLIDLSKTPSVDLMVLGSLGEKNWLDRLFGSVAIEVARDAYCPVLLIPQNSKYEGIDNILYAASAESAKPRQLKITVDWAKLLVSKLHFVHVNTAADEESKTYLTDLFEHYVKQYAPDLPHTINHIEANSDMAGLWDYSSKNDIDIVVIVSYHHDFWASFIHHSVSKDLLHHARMPILFLNNNVKHQPPV